MENMENNETQQYAGRAMPQAPDAEVYLLGGLIQGPDTLSEIMPLLEEEKNKEREERKSKRELERERKKREKELEKEREKEKERKEKEREKERKSKRNKNKDKDDDRNKEDNDKPVVSSKPVRRSMKDRIQDISGQ